MVFFTLPLVRLMRTADFSTSFSMTMVRSWIEMTPVFVILIAILPLFAWDTITLQRVMSEQESDADDAKEEVATAVGDAEPDREVANLS